jgi:hypothetical protein
LILHGFFNKVFLIYDDDLYLYTTTTSIHIDMFLTQGLICQNVPAETLRILLRSNEDLVVLPSQTISGISLNNGIGEYVTFISPFGTGMGTNSGTLVFLVSTQTYRSFFNQEVGDEKNSYIINGEICQFCDMEFYEVCSRSMESYPLSEKFFTGIGIILLALKGS